MSYPAIVETDELHHRLISSKNPNDFFEVDSFSPLGGELMALGDKTFRRSYRLWVNHRVVHRDLPAELIVRGQRLLYDHNLYFSGLDAATLISAEDMVASRARPDGITAAADLMRRAAANQTERRLPIDVEQMADGRFLVLDGNSTFLNGWASGWPDFPCRVSA